MPSHCYRIRVFDRDLIRGGHYGQRSCEPHLKAEHMAAPTNAANVKKALANSEPSTHGTLLPRAIAAACLQLAEPDVRLARACSIAARRFAISARLRSSEVWHQSLAATTVSSPVCRSFTAISLCGARILRRCVASPSASCRDTNAACYRPEFRTAHPAGWSSSPVLFGLALHCHGGRVLHLEPVGRVTAVPRDERHPASGLYATTITSSLCRS